MPGRLASFALGAALVTALGLGLALYGREAGGNGAGPCADAAATAARAAPFARGEVAAMQMLDAARPAPEIRFQGPDGAETTLADLRGTPGKALLVNLWATWCAPCKAEMPALDRLQATLGGDAFAVVAINVDTRNLDKPAAWLAENGIRSLTRYADPGGRVLPAIQRDTGSTGLPTTLLIDPKGCTVGVMKGPADWSSPDGLRLIRAVLGQGA